MGSGEHESGKIIFRNAERNNGRTVSGYVIAFADLEIPFFAFGKFGISFCGKFVTDGFHSVIGRRAFGDKIKKLFIHKVISLI